MSEQLPNRPRRPPPPPPSLPARRPPPPPAYRAAPPPAPARREVAGSLDRGRPGEWQPLPWPTLMKDAVARVEGHPLAEPDQRERLLSRQGAWTAILSWAFGVIVLLLVVAPMSAIPKLLGPFNTPVSGAAFGPIVA